VNYHEKHENENARQYVYRILKDEIMSWTLTPGEVLNDLHISTRLGVSRTPVREALFALKEDHLVSVYARNKTVVSLIDWQLITEGKFGNGFVPGLIAVAVMIGIVVYLVANSDKKLQAEYNLKTAKKKITK